MVRHVVFMRLSRRPRLVHRPSLHEGVRESAQNLISHFPKEKLTISTSDASFGLQLADIYLWLVNRAMSENTLPNELRHFATSLVDPRTIDGISISGMVARFQAFEKKLPRVQDIPDEFKAKSEAAVAGHRQ